MNLPLPLLLFLFLFLPSCTTQPHTKKLREADLVRVDFTTGHPSKEVDKHTGAIDKAAGFADEKLVKEIDCPFEIAGMMSFVKDKNLLGVILFSDPSSPCAYLMVQQDSTEGYVKMSDGAKAFLHGLMRMP